MNEDEYKRFEDEFKKSKEYRESTEGQVVELRKAIFTLGKDIKNIFKNMVHGVDKMRDINRIDPFLERFKVLWKKYPDMRFAQLVYFLVSADKDIYYIEESEMLENINKQINRGIK